MYVFFTVTNGKHEWVPKDIAQAAEKYAKVSKLWLNGRTRTSWHTIQDGKFSWISRLSSVSAFCSWPAYVFLQESLEEESSSEDEDWNIKILVLFI